MITIFLRTVIIYLLLIGTMRLLGKRQLGELEISELVTTILLSEIASLPVSNQDIPILHAIIPLITIMTFEIGASLLLTKFPQLKNALSARPSVLIRKGVLNEKELTRNRISLEELVSELRLKNITDLSHVEYAILEQNGMLSVIPKVEYQQPTLKQEKIEAEESGIMHIIISQGVWNEYNLMHIGKKKVEFEEYIRKKNLALSEILLLMVDDAGNYNLVVKEKSK